MISFAEILARAAARKGGLDAIVAEVTPARTRDELAAIGDDRWLSQMSKRIFQAGFVWRVIEDKWPAFEAAFAGFQPRPLAMWSDEQMEAAARQKNVVANMPKVMAIRGNAQFLTELADEHGSAARFFAEWPDEDYIGLLEVMKKRGSRLGGNTGSYILRFMGKPAFILSESVVKALIQDGVVAKAPGGKKDMAAVQAAFNAWAAESGRDLSQISRILALSVD